MVVEILKYRIWDTKIRKWASPAFLDPANWGPLFNGTKDLGVGDIIDLTGVVSGVVSGVGAN